MYSYYSNHDNRTIRHSNGQSWRYLDLHVCVTYITTFQLRAAYSSRYCSLVSRSHCTDTPTAFLTPIYFATSSRIQSLLFSSCECPSACQTLLADLEQAEVKFQSLLHLQPADAKLRLGFFVNIALAKRLINQVPK